MGSFADDFEVDVLLAMTGQATTILATTPLTNVYCDLTSTAPTKTSAGTSLPSSDGYAMVDTAGDWGTPSGSPTTVSNSNAITFPTATGDWPAVAGFNLWADAGKTKRLGWGTVTKTVESGDTASFAVGDLDVQMS